MTLFLVWESMCCAEPAGLHKQINAIHTQTSDSLQQLQEISSWIEVPKNFQLENKLTVNRSPVRISAIHSLSRRTGFGSSKSILKTLNGVWRTLVQSHKSIGLSNNSWSKRIMPIITSIFLKVTQVLIVPYLVVSHGIEHTLPLSMHLYHHSHNILQSHCCT